MQGSIEPIAQQLEGWNEGYPNVSEDVIFVADSRRLIEECQYQNLAWVPVVRGHEEDQDDHMHS